MADRSEWLRLAATRRSLGGNIEPVKPRAARQIPALPARHIVDAVDIPPLVEEQVRHRRSDEAGTTRHEDPSSHSPPSALMSCDSRDGSKGRSTPKRYRAASTTPSPPSAADAARRRTDGS